mmetsp:Transcript_41160/g.30268  ORF Transcript_41160/g.30268 Transcript_41160/m.30268 type:complete len:99 (+) Transcript_41160:194-490(+)
MQAVTEEEPSYLPPPTASSSAITRPITTQMLVKHATNAKNKDRKQTKRFLESITHLSLESKHITDMENLEQCPNLTVLYLFDNMLTQIRGLDLHTKLV